MQRLTITVILKVAVTAGIAVTASYAAHISTETPPHRLTFSKDIAPILRRSCTGCHRPGEIAPMSLLTYKDARPWARAIREKVVTREMPPWHADPRYGSFINDCRLSQ